MAERPAHQRASACRTILILGVFLSLGLAGRQVSAEASELRQSPIVKAVQQSRSAIVNIRGEKTIAAAAAANEPGRRVNGMGTGVVIDPRGYIVTNFHVVDGVREIQVTRDNREKSIAKLVARDQETDLAIIKINVAEKLPVITIGTSSDLMPGESVIAVGNAYGYENTVTRGIISALHRAVQVSDAQFYDDLIQTDASINPGNSGGPLLNIDGEMIGINVAVRAGAQGIGFAIPVDKVMTVASDLIASHVAKKSRHGVVLATEGKVKSSQGVAVASVDSDSPAAEAGLEAGDIIEAINDVRVSRSLDFYRSLLDCKPGERLELTVRRKSEDLSISLTPMNSSRDSAAVTGQSTWDVLGLDLSPISGDEFRQKYQTRYRGGLAVTAVRPDSPAASQGIRAGDVLVGMHIWETISLENVTYILHRPDFATINPLKFFILRGGETLYGYIPVVAQKPGAQAE